MENMKEIDVFGVIYVKYLRTITNFDGIVPFVTSKINLGHALEKIEAFEKSARCTCFLNFLGT